MGEAAGSGGRIFTAPAASRSTIGQTRAGRFGPPTRPSRGAAESAGGSPAEFLRSRRARRQAREQSSLLGKIVIYKRRAESARWGLGRDGSAGFVPAKPCSAIAPVRGLGPICDSTRACACPGRSGRAAHAGSPSPTSPRTAALGPRSSGLWLPATGHAESHQHDVSACFAPDFRRPCPGTGGQRRPRWAPMANNRAQVLGNRLIRAGSPVCHVRYPRTPGGWHGLPGREDPRAVAGSTGSGSCPGRRQCDPRQGTTLKRRNGRRMRDPGSGEGVTGLDGTPDGKESSPAVSAPAGS